MFKKFCLFMTMLLLLVCGCGKNEPSYLYEDYEHLFDSTDGLSLTEMFQYDTQNQQDFLTFLHTLEIYEEDNPDSVTFQRDEDGIHITVYYVAENGLPSYFTGSVFCSEKEFGLWFPGLVDEEAVNWFRQEIAPDVVFCGTHPEYGYSEKEFLTIRPVEDRIYLADYDTNDLYQVVIQEVPDNPDFEIITETSSYPVSTIRIPFDFVNKTNADLPLPGTFYRLEVNRNGIWYDVPHKERFKGYGGGWMMPYNYGTYLPSEGGHFDLNLTDFPWGYAGEYRITIYQTSEHKGGRYPIAGCEFTLTE